MKIKKNSWQLLLKLKEIELEKQERKEKETKGGVVLPPHEINSFDNTLLDARA